MDENFKIKELEKGLMDLLADLPYNLFPKLTLAINSSVKKLKEPMQLAIIGKISSSKSTLVNAILGKEGIMPTGQKEVTYNVGWLKYGKSGSDIIIHHKDGTPNTSKSQEEFCKWSTDNDNTEIDNISYIEIFDDAEILRMVNIIDTPGLDALRGKDSQNTLDFISNVRPDAVIMLFTHSVSENVLDIVRKYNTGCSFNPLNAIGILSKIDVLWQEDFERIQSALEIGQKMVANRMRKDKMLKRTLFNLYPMSALLFLASSTIKHESFNKVKLLSECDECILKVVLKSVPKFLDPSVNIPLQEAERIDLVNQLGLYGISMLATLLKKTPDLSFDEVKDILYKESGAYDFMKVLHNHFGSRARLIRLESIFQSLNQEIDNANRTIQDMTSSKVLVKAKAKLRYLFSTLMHEHLEYETLNKIYNGELNLNDDDKDELLALWGENGFSAPERMRMPVGTRPTELVTKSLERESFWRKSIALEPDPEEREWMNVALKSYTQLRHTVVSMNYQYEQSKLFLFNE